MKNLTEIASTLRCGYCDYYATGEIKRVGDQIFKKCLPYKKPVDFGHKICEYFSPQDIFFCRQYGERIPFTICFNRRRNRSGFEKYNPCKKCRQFDQEIRELITVYWLECHKVKQFQNPNKGARKIKRRSKTIRKLKRRSPKLTKPVRKIRRRKKK